jgi:hypothetical protein
VIRWLYWGLLWLHPPAFRRAFAGEMLWIYDETSGAALVWLLFGDALVSLARQWVLRTGAWKVAAAGVGGLLQITLGGLIFGLFHELHGTSHLVREPRPDSIDMLRLIYLAAGVAAGVVASVLALTLWLRSFTGRRIHHDA